MIESKSLTVDELKSDYSDRHGFIYSQSGVTDSTKIQPLCESLISAKITEVLPEFTVQLTPNVLVFVYGEGTSFKSGEFFQKSRGIGQAMNIWQVDTLMGFLRDN